MSRFGDTPALLKPNLCDSCSHSTIVQGVKFDEKIVRCNVIEGRIRFKVVECNGYKHKNEPDLWEMKKIAWRIASDRKAKKIGFYSPTKYYEGIRQNALESVGMENEDSLD